MRMCVFVLSCVQLFSTPWTVIHQAPLSTEFPRQEYWSGFLIWTGGSTPLLCLEGVPDLPVAPQDEAGLTKTFQTWPRGWFHIP